MAANNNLSLSEIRALAEAAGWTRRRTTGQHEIWKSPTGATVTIGNDARAAAGDFRRAGLAIPASIPFETTPATPEQTIQALQADSRAISAALNAAVKLVYEMADSLGELRKSVGEIAAELRGSIVRTENTVKTMIRDAQAAYDDNGARWLALEKRVDAIDALITTIQERSDPIDAFRKRMQGV